MLRNRLNYRNTKLKYYCFAILFLNCMILSVLLDISTYIYDDGYYWRIADPVLHEGSFDIMLFPETFRGYLFPIFILIVKTYVFGVWGWRVLSALMVSSIFGVFLPKIMNYAIHTVRITLRVILAELVFFYVWGHFLQHPLSDLPAVFFLLGAICFWLSSKGEGASVLRENLYGLASGLFLYAAYNCRAVFLYSIIIFLVGIAVWGVKRLNIKRTACMLICIAVGMIIASVPQCMINYQYLGKFSPKVYTDQLFDYQYDLQSAQLFWGLSSPRYETYTGDMEYYPTAQVYFDDPVGNRIIENENLTLETFSICELIKVFLKFPLDMIALYARHLFAMLTPLWNQTYISNIHTDKFFLVLFSIIIWLTSGIGILIDLHKNRLLAQGRTIWIIGAIILPSLLQLAGASELRFFLPVYLLVYVHVFVRIDYKEWFIFYKSSWLQITIAVLLIMILWITVVGDTMLLNREQTLLFHDRLILD